ncbi:MAG: hypothetical protein ACOY3P_24640 [Planctomycetota bacterium]
MTRKYAWILAASAAMMVAGCGRQSETPATAPDDAAAMQHLSESIATNSDPTNVARLEPPAAAVAEFLEAVRTGNDEKATAMLTSVAREKAVANNGGVRPPASDTACFEVGAVQWIGDDGARVGSTWTDVDVGSGEPQTDEALWVLRKEADGWRIAGVAATVFDGEPPLLLNFEDPEEMQRKQQWVREEIVRRSTTALQAQAGPMDEEVRR